MRMLAVIAALAAGEALAETGVQSTSVFRGGPRYRTAPSPSSQAKLGAAFDRAGPGTTTFLVWNAAALSGRPEPRADFGAPHD